MNEEYRNGLKAMFKKTPFPTPQHCGRCDRTFKGPYALCPTCNAEMSRIILTADSLPDPIEPIGESYGDGHYMAGHLPLSDDA